MHYATLSASKFGKDQRSSYFLYTSTYMKPPPGSHSTTFVDKHSAPKFGFGTSTREKNYLGLSKQNLYRVPGPGSYKIPVHIGRTPEFTNVKRDEKYQYV